MSHYDKKIEDYEDALFALLMDRLSEEEGEKYKLLNEQLKNDPQYKVPEEFSQCCYYTIKKEFSKMRRRTLEKAAVKLFQRASMLMVAFALLLTSALALSPSPRRSRHPAPPGTPSAPGGSSRCTAYLPWCEMRSHSPPCGSRYT